MGRRLHYPTAFPARDCLAIAGLGVVVGCVLGLIVRYAVRTPIDRRIIVPWGSGVGSIFTIVAAWQTSDLGPIRYFLAGMVAVIVLVNLGIRMIVTAIRGPLDDTPSWAAKPK